MGYRELKRMLLYEIGLLIAGSGVIGTACGYFIAIVQFKEMKNGPAAQVVFPHQFLAGEILIVLSLSFIMAMIAVRKVKEVNMIEALKNENE